MIVSNLIAQMRGYSPNEKIHGTLVLADGKSISLGGVSITQAIEMLTPYADHDAKVNGRRQTMVEPRILVAEDSLGIVPVGW